MSPPDEQVAYNSEARFIAALRRYAAPSDGSAEVNPRQRAALAILRRGLGKPIGQVVEMYPYVVPHLPPDVKPWQEDAYFLIASLFATHPHTYPEDASGHATNLGVSFARLRDARDSSSIENRFTALLDASTEALPDHLRQAIGLLRATDVPVNYLQLLRDIRCWQRDDRSVQRAWARSYWGTNAVEETTSSTEAAAPAGADK